jgi:hypothetical protein
LSVNAQTIKSEECNYRDVQLIAYSESLSENQVIAKMQVVLLDREVKKLDELTEKEIKKIQKSARKHNSCTVYIGFEKKILDDEVNPHLTEKHLTYMIVKELEK